jgi:hypothetical protein
MLTGRIFVYTVIVVQIDLALLSNLDFLLGLGKGTF